MRTGAIIQPDKINRHLDDTYIEVFPDGNVRDLRFTVAIPALNKTYSKRDVLTGPTPLLVRKSYWDAHYLELKPVT